MTAQSASKKVHLAVDIGGTFVDAIEFDPATAVLSIHKAPTTPSDPSRGVMAATAGLRPSLAEVSTFVHGTTLGLNAILQRRGADIGLITNAGFEDILEVARADVPARRMYDFTYAPPPPLARRRHRLGVAGRIDVTGAELVPLDETAVVDAAQELVDRGLTSLAICFLHSYANPSHEQRAAELIRTRFPEVSVSVSTELSREYREYERTSTACVDAYIRPILRDYLGDLGRRLEDAAFTGSFHVMRSGGGAMTSDVARRTPLLTVLSGPAGGIAGARHLADTYDWDRLISFDVGGTSVDACVVVDGAPTAVHEAAIDDLPLQIPVFDIRTIGAGGGSIAWVDEGLLKVGPHSAGADPGPACYGMGGTEPTVTDAALVLGHLDPADFLGGRMDVDVEAARKAVAAQVADPLAMTVEQAAARIIEVLLARTVGAIREITVERGLDPREFRLVAFGGAGPLLGPLVGREMGVAATVIPPFPAAFSALGMLLTDLEYDVSSTVLKPLTDQALADMAPLVRDLTAQGVVTLAEQGISEDARTAHATLDLRYRGQEHTLAVDLEDDAASVTKSFNSAHVDRYGHKLDEPCEIVTLRVRATGTRPKPSLPRLEVHGDVPAQPPTTRRAWDIATRSLVDMPVHRRTHLPAGCQMQGPLIVQEPTATTVVFGDQHLAVDDHGQLIITGNPT